MITLNNQRVEIIFLNPKALIPAILFTSTFQYSNKMLIRRLICYLLFLGQKKNKDNLFHTFRQPTIYNLYTYNSVKHNSYEVIQMASRYKALTIKIDNFIGIMPSLRLNISTTRSQPYWFLFNILKGILWCIPTLSFKKIQRWFIFQFAINQKYVRCLNRGSLLSFTGKLWI